MPLTLFPEPNEGAMDLSFRRNHESAKERNREGSKEGPRARDYTDEQNFFPYFLLFFRVFALSRLRD
jgi:hypothetical protein